MMFKKKFVESLDTFFFFFKRKSNEKLVTHIFHHLPPMFSLFTGLASQSLSQQNSSVDVSEVGGLADLSHFLGEEI